MKVNILYEDAVLLAVNKAHGLPVHKTVDPSRPHLQGLVEKQLGQELVLFHRLDLDTTGVVLFGKDPAINRAMTEMFRDREAQKTYLAAVDGRWNPAWKEVKTHIKKSGGGKWINVPKGKGADYAETHFELIDSNGDRSLIKAFPKTGRTHQIRLHCLEMGHAILGDRFYGRVDKHGVPIALHALKIEFDHPLSGKKLQIEAPLPDHWKAYWLKGLKI